MIQMERKINIYSMLACCPDVLERPAGGWSSCSLCGS